MALKTLIIRPWMTISSRQSGYFTISPPLGAGYVAAALEKDGHEVGILDIAAEGWDNITVSALHPDLRDEGLSDEGIRDRVLDFKPDIVGISNSSTPQFHNTLRAASLVKEVLPSCPVLVGGVHPSSVPKECIAEKTVDFLIHGEGEIAAVELCEALEGKRPIEKVGSLYWKDSEGIRHNPPAQLPDLDTLAPSYHLLPMERYFEAGAMDSTVRGGHGKRWSPIISSRGCPYKCSFCSVHLVEGRKWRGRSPEHFVAEMELLHDTYGIRTFTIEDSNFTLDIERAIQICELISKRLPDVTFSLPNGIRADKMPQRFVDALVSSGCSEVTVAIEHGDQAFLDEVIKKKLDLSVVEENVRRVRKAGVPISGFFVLGIPPETKQTLSATRAMILRLAKLGMLPQLNIAMPMPGTEMLDRALSNGYLSRPLNTIDYLPLADMKPLVDSPALTGRDLLIARRHIYFRALLTALLFNPKYFFSFPFIRASLRDLVRPGTILRRLRKILGLLGI
jgi:anaerobic magnesium-protoporphyrin IX monomethyl ester cyclase